MADIIKVGNLTTVLEQRIRDRLLRLNPDDPRFVDVLSRIGAMIETQAKRNATQKRIIDTGTLRDSIQNRLFKSGTISGVKVGSFGVPYAAAHEFGFDGTVTVNPKRARTSAFGRPTKPYVIPPYTRRHFVRKRPYLYPAVNKFRNQIRDLIRGLFV